MRAFSHTLEGISPVPIICPDAPRKGRQSSQTNSRRPWSQSIQTGTKVTRNSSKILENTRRKAIERIRETIYAVYSVWCIVAVHQICSEPLVLTLDLDCICMSLNNWAARALLLSTPGIKNSSTEVLSQHSREGSGRSFKRHIFAEEGIKYIIMNSSSSCHEISSNKYQLHRNKAYSYILSI